MCYCGVDPSTHRDASGESTSTAVHAVLRGETCFLFADYSDILYFSEFSPFFFQVCLSCIHNNANTVINLVSISIELCYLRCTLLVPHLAMLQ